MTYKRPVIGLTPQVDIEHPFRAARIFPQYIRSLERAGGVGIVLPLTDNEEVMEQLVRMCDGFLFTGGQDLEPFMYGEEESESLSMSTGYAPERDKFESVFYSMVRRSGKPVLAICRGFQIINVLHGGTIVQDLPVNPEDPHAILHPAWSSQGERFHDVAVVEGTLLSEIMGKGVLSVNSYHHQGVREVGSGLTVSGVSPDGLVEAFDIDGLDFGLAVQWHPEVLFDSGRDDGMIFKAFIKACRNPATRARSLPESLAERKNFSAVQKRLESNRPALKLPYRQS